jgi:hypothetical protein
MPMASRAVQGWSPGLVAPSPGQAAPPAPGSRAVQGREPWGRQARAEEMLAMGRPAGHRAGEMLATDGRGGDAANGQTNVGGHGMQAAARGGGRMTRT